MFLVEGAFEEMMEHLALMSRKVQNSGKHLCQKLRLKSMKGLKLQMPIPRGTD